MEKTASPRPRVRTETVSAQMPKVRHHGHVSGDADRHWTLLTNHGRILLLIAQESDVRIRDLADAAGVTERTAQTIVTDLENAGYIRRSREGRRNVYSVNRRQPFRHPAESGHRVGELIDLFASHE